MQNAILKCHDYSAEFPISNVSLKTQQHYVCVADVHPHHAMICFISLPTLSLSLCNPFRDN